MNHINTVVIALVFSTVLFPASCIAGPGEAGASKRVPSARKKVAFHVIGMKKTQSGAT